MRIKISKIGLIETLLAALLIIDGNTVFHSTTDYDLHLPVVIAIVLCCLIAICSSRDGYHIETSYLFAPILFFAYYGIYLIIKSSSIVKEDYFFTFVLSLPLFLLYFRLMHNEGRVNAIFYKIDDIIVVIAFLSTIVWVLGPLLNIISTNCSINIFWGYSQNIDGYFGILYVLTRDTTFGTGLIQNNAFFTEAPMLNIWLDIAIGTELFLKEEYSKKRLVILFACLITTFSTTGYLFLIILFFLKRLERTVKSNVKKNKVVMMGLLVILVPVLAFATIELINIKSSTNSFAIRMANYAVAVKLFFEYPIFGSGYGNISIFGLAQYKTTKRNIGYSNSIGSILGTGGLWMTLPYFLGIVIPSVKKYRGKIETICFMTIYVFLSITTIFNARVLQSLFIAYGISFIWAKIK